MDVNAITNAYASNTYLRATRYRQRDAAGDAALKYIASPITTMFIKSVLESTTVGITNTDELIRVIANNHLSGLVLSTYNNPSDADINTIVSGARKAKKHYIQIVLMRLPDEANFKRGHALLTAKGLPEESAMDCNTEVSHRITMFIDNTEDHIQFIFLTNKVNAEVEKITFRKACATYAHLIYTYDAHLWNGRNICSEDVIDMSQAKYLADNYMTMDVAVCLEQAYAFVEVLIRESALRKTLATANSSAVSNKLNNLHIQKQNFLDEIERMRRNIDDKEMQLAVVMRDIGKIDTGLLTAQLFDVDLIVDSLPAIKAVRIQNQTMYVQIETDLMQWSADDYNSLRKSKTGILKDIPMAHAALIDELLYHRTVRLTFAQEIKLVNYLDPDTSVQYIENVGQYLGNPHHRHFNCWGDYRRLIESAIKSADYYGVLMLLVNATSGLNILDGSVFSRFVRDDMREYCDIGWKVFTDATTGQRMSLKEYEQQYGAGRRVTEEHVVYNSNDKAEELPVVDILQAEIPFTPQPTPVVE